MDEQMNIIINSPTFLEKHSMLLLILVIFFFLLIQWHIYRHIKIFKPDFFKKAFLIPIYYPLRYAYAEMDRTEAIICIICTLVSLALIIVLLVVHGTFVHNFQQPINL